MITFGGTRIPDFIRVNNISYSILPPIETKSTKVSGRPGTYDFGIELGEREITVEIQVIANNPSDIITKTRELAVWLYHKDLQPFITDREPTKQYMARYSGTSVINEIFRVGQGTLTFLCPDPFAESTQESVIVDTTGSTESTPMQVTNLGTAEAYPIIELAVSNTSPTFTVVNNDKFIHLGDDTSSVEKEIVDPNPTVLSDDFSTFGGWTSGILIDEGTIYGTFASNGDVAYQSGKDYGSGTAWKGAAAVKALPNLISDFTVDAHVKLVSQNAKQIGRVQVYLFDENNVNFGRVSLRDTDPNMDKPIFEARAGSFGNGTTFVESHGYTKGAFKQFQGLIRIRRKGDVWEAYIAKVDARGNHHTREIRRWVDTGKKFSAHKLAKIQIHVGALASYETVNTLSLTAVQVVNHSIQNVNYDVQSPIVFKPGDIVTIDNNRALVLKNGEPYFQALSPSSDFFSLAPGANGIMVTPPASTVTVRYKERWL